MLIDVSVQTNGVDYRERGAPVVVPQQVIEARYNPRGSQRAIEVRGNRAKIAELLRKAGYNVQEGEPADLRTAASLLGSRTSPAKAKAARLNGARSKGRPRSEVLLATPYQVELLAQYDRGFLMDLVAHMMKGGNGTPLAVDVVQVEKRRERAREARRAE